MSFMKAFHSIENAFKKSSPIIQAISNPPNIGNLIKNEINVGEKAVNNTTKTITNTVGSVENTVNNVQKEIVKMMNGGHVRKEDPQDDFQW